MTARTVTAALRHRRGFLSKAANLWMMVALCALFLLAPVFLLPRFASSSAAYDVRVSNALRPPSREFRFGTDALGRSVWDRTLLGAALSFRTVAGSLAVAFPLSLMLGGVAGLTAGRWPDHAITWLIALLHTIPFFLLVVAMAAVLGPGTGALPWLIGVVVWAAPARIVRAEVQRLSAAPFVRAERALGCGGTTTFLRSLLPFAVAPAAVSLLYLFPEIIGIDAVLSLFGLGAQPPTPTLGGLIYDGIRRWDAAPWLAGLPTLALIGYCFALHILADRLASQIAPPAK
jgi:peptide/nickel transport system permease protein